MRNIQLLAIDCQQDFCNPTIGSLYVPGAEQDMINLANMINRLSGKIKAIHSTIDAHRVVDISHPIMHISSDGSSPTPFTTITEEDYEKGTWRCKNPQWQAKVKDYIHQLKVKGRYDLTIWPEHCIIGSQGASLQKCISDAFIQWERDNFALVDYQVKGSNYMVEAYGALEAEVVDPSDSSTMLNTSLIKVLAEADELLIAGEALSHCVAITVNQVADNFGEENIKKFTLLSDCCSSVAGCEGLGADFIKNMTARGMKKTTSVAYLA